MLKPKVFLTRKWPQSVENALKKYFDVTVNADDRPLSREEIQIALMESDGLLTTVTDTLQAETFSDLTPRTRIIANYGVGYSHINIEAAQKVGITVTNTPDVLNNCTADLAMTLMLMTARRTGEGEREVRSGLWRGWRPTHLIGTSVSGKTLGIIGFGRIGQAVARRAHFGFGMSILVQSRSTVDRKILAETNAVQIGTLDEMLPSCDFVSLHCPGGAKNRHLINQEKLEIMKPSAILINTARGEVVDESALVLALKNGSICAAGLDVFEAEPHLHPGLLECENAVLLPHLGSSTEETRVAMGMRAMKNLQQFFDGELPNDKVS